MVFPVQFLGKRRNPSAQDIVTGVQNIKESESRVRANDLISDIRELEIGAFPQQQEAARLSAEEEAFAGGLAQAASLGANGLWGPANTIINQLRNSNLSPENLEELQSYAEVVFDPQDTDKAVSLAAGLQGKVGGADERANMQFGSSRPVIATLQSGAKKNGTMEIKRDPEGGGLKSVFVPDVGSLDPNDPIVSTSNVGRLGLTGEEQNAQTLARQRELENIRTEQGREREEDKKKIERSTGLVTAGLEAADALAITRRSLDLLERVQTGGFKGLQLRIEEMLGYQTEDEAELSTGLSRVVLAQLKPIFGSQFTKGEGDALKRIEASIGKSTVGNKRLLQQMMRMQERAARRGISAAGEMNDAFGAEEIQRSLDFRITEPGQATETPTSETSTVKEGDIVENDAGDRLILQNGEWVPYNG